MAWVNQVKTVSYFLDNNICVASIDYRQLPDYKFPTTIHDIKAAIRFLRAKNKKYGYNSKYIAIAGESAGGHLALLTGVTNGLDFFHS